MSQATVRRLMPAYRLDDVNEGFSREDTLDVPVKILVHFFGGATFIFFALHPYFFSQCHRHSPLILHSNTVVNF